MILTSGEITQLGIVHNAKVDALQHTTYNATVGQILSEGRIIQSDRFDLPPRGIVWVVSNEEFELPVTVTGLATLKTTWTHDGILALNVGIVDPGWHGPLAAALVNFSKQTFTVEKDAQFLRLAFHKHATTSAPLIRDSMDRYISKIRDKSAKTASTFLDMTALSREVADEVFTLPRWLAAFTKYSVAFAIGATIIALLAIFVPIAWDISKDRFADESKIERLEAELSRLKEQIGAPKAAVTPNRSPN